MADPDHAREASPVYNTAGNTVPFFLEIGENDFPNLRNQHVTMLKALEFIGRVGGLELQGIDLITLNDEGRLQALDVLIRPANAIAALQERVGPRMLKFLAERSDA